MSSHTNDSMDIDPEMVRPIEPDSGIDKAIDEDTEMEIASTAQTSQVQVDKLDATPSDRILCGRFSVVRPHRKRAPIVVKGEKTKTHTHTTRSGASGSSRVAKSRSPKSDCPRLRERLEKVQLHIMLGLSQSSIANAMGPGTFSSSSSLLASSVIEAVGANVRRRQSQRRREIELIQLRMVQEMGLSSFDAWIMPEMKSTLQRQTKDASIPAAQSCSDQTQTNLEGKGKEVAVAGHQEMSVETSQATGGDEGKQLAVAGQRDMSEEKPQARADAEDEDKQLAVVDNVLRPLDMEFLDRIKKLTVENPAAAAEELFDIMNKVGQIKLEDEEREDEL